MLNRTGYAIMLVCLVFCMGNTLTARGQEAPQKTKVDPRENFLSMEALCGYEGMPYKFLIPPEQYVNTKNDPNDIYLDMESLCGEDPPFKYVVIPGKHIKTKIDLQDLQASPEELMSEDPTSLK